MYILLLPPCAYPAYSKGVEKVWKCLYPPHMTLNHTPWNMDVILSCSVLLTWGWISNLGLELSLNYKARDMIFAFKIIYLTVEVNVTSIKILISHKNVPFLPKRTKIGCIKVRDMIWCLLEMRNSIFHHK